MLRAGVIVIDLTIRSGCLHRLISHLVTIWISSRRLGYSKRQCLHQITFHIGSYRKYPRDQPLWYQDQYVALQESQALLRVSVPHSAVRQASILAPTSESSGALWRYRYFCNHGLSPLSILSVSYARFTEGSTFNKWQGKRLLKLWEQQVAKSQHSNQ